MKEQYSVNEILSAMNDLYNLKKVEKKDSIVIKKPILKNLDVPSNTLKLIEEAEKTIRSKLQSK